MHGNGGKWAALLRFPRHGRAIGPPRGMVPDYGPALGQFARETVRVRTKNMPRCVPSHHRVPQPPRVLLLTYVRRICAIPPF